MECARMAICLRKRSVSTRRHDNSVTVHVTVHVTAYKTSVRVGSGMTSRALRPPVSIGKCQRYSP